MEEEEKPDCAKSEPFSDVVSKYEFTNEMKQNAKQIIQSNQTEIASFLKEKFEKEATKSWDVFYKKNTDHFFKDRKWIKREFPELQPQRISNYLKSSTNNCSSSALLVDVGCGVGNAVLPLLYDNPNLHAICVDCSQNAIDILQHRWNTLSIESTEEGIRKEPRGLPTEGGAKDTNGQFSQTEVENLERFSPFGKLERAAVADIVQDKLDASICEDGMADFVLLLYVLSAIHPKHHRDVVSRCSRLLKPNGTLFFRDYGRYDMAQLRFAKSGKSKVEDNLYVRYDGTYAYYFEQEQLTDLFCTYGGLVEDENRYHLREFLNRKTQVKMPRVLIQGKFRKPERELIN